MLIPICKETLDPGQFLVSDVIVMGTDCHAIMWNLIKSLAEIQQNCINLLPSIYSNCKFMFGSDELCLTTHHYHT